MDKQPNKCIDCGKVISENATRCRRCAIQAELPARSERAKKQWQDPERRRRVIAKISEANKKRWQDPEYRRRMSAKMSEAAKKRWADPEYRRRMGAKRSEAAKKRWADPEYRRKHAEGMKRLQARRRSQREAEEKKG